MTKTESIPNATMLSAAKLRLLEKYLHGDVSKAATDTARITPRPASTPAPLAPVQEEVWRRACAAADVPPFYNESITIHRHGPVDANILQRCFTEIIRRHEVWRTGYEVVDGQPVQVTRPAPAAAPLPWDDLRNLDIGKREAEALRLATEDARKPFDLRTGPLVRARLVTLTEADHRLFVTMHQSVVDGVTVNNVFPSELAALYEAFAAGKPSPLAELPVQYADYAYWHQQWLQSEAASSPLAYWRERLLPAPASLDWPPNRRAGHAPTYRGVIRPFVIGHGLTQQLKALCRDQGITLFMGLLAGCSAVLHRYTNQDDFVIGTLAPSGRKRPEVQNLIGYFLNPVPLRMDLSGDPSAHELLRRTRETVSGAIANDDAPMEWLLKKLGLLSDPTAKPLFEIVLSLAPELTPLSAGWTQTFMDVESGGARWGLYLELREGPEGLLGRAQYNPDLFEPTSVARLLRDWQTMLEALVNAPESLLSQLSAVRPYER
ncbi:MAG TPA: condensation domain-containing protein [Verrucomicrobiae bacterium]|nr:condensation domain-containing protein [Verrucomicrobiae bacterium]